MEWLTHSDGWVVEQDFDDNDRYVGCCVPGTQKECDHGEDEIIDEIF